MNETGKLLSDFARLVAWCIERGLDVPREYDEAKLLRDLAVESDRLLEDRDRIVTWLRAIADQYTAKGAVLQARPALHNIADAIERGDHEGSP